MKQLARGFVLIELVVFIVVFTIIATISFNLVRAVTQKAKIATAKAQISQMALALERIKEDTGNYPTSLIAIFQSNPPSGQERGWEGPYAQRFNQDTGLDTPLDPWGAFYFYAIPPTTIPPTNYFSSPQIVRQRAQPITYYYSFTAPGGQAQVVVTNYGIDSARIYINGVEVVSPDDFRENPKPQIITKPVTLNNGGNSAEIRVTSGPEDYFYVSVGTPQQTVYVPTREYFILGSYGKDKRSGGRGFDRDIVWYSNKYPNFQ
jgi:type II secretion system protein G